MSNPVTVNMQRGAAMPPAYNSQGNMTQPVPQQFGAPQQQFNMRAPSQQFGAGQPQQYPGGAPNQYNAPYNSAPPQSNPYNTNAPPPYSSAPAAYQAGGPQPPYGAQQQYANPPLQQFSQQQLNVPPNAQGFVGSVSLQKGGNMSLSKANPNLAKIRIGLGWDVRQTGGPAFDLDASAFLLKGDGRVRMAQDLIFYNNKQSVDGCAYHHGDNLTGAGDGDDEIVSLDLTRVPMEIQKVVFVVSIYEAELRRQNFGMVSRAFIRVVDDLSNQEMCRFDLSEEASMLSSMIFGEVYRYSNEWKFRAVGQGIQGGLTAIGAMFGLNLS